jgi:hypothetical protein
MAPQSGWAQHVLKGPRLPHWGCSCGEAENWASRLQCRNCSKAAPARVATAAREAAKAPAASQPKGPGGAWKKGPPQVDEVAKLRKEIAGLKLQIKQGQGVDADDKPDDPEDEAAAKREKIQKEMDTLKIVLGEKHPEVLARASQLEELQKQRPVGARLLAAQRKISKMEKKLEQKQKAVQDVEQSIAEFQQRLKDLKGESEAIQKELEAQKQDQAKLVEAEKIEPEGVSGVPKLGAFQRWAEQLATGGDTPASLVQAIQAIQKFIADKQEAYDKAQEESEKAKQHADVDMLGQPTIEEQDLVDALGTHSELGPVLGAMDSSARQGLAQSISEAMASKRRKVADVSASGHPPSG